MGLAIAVAICSFDPSLFSWLIVMYSLDYLLSTRLILSGRLIVANRQRL